MTLYGLGNILGVGVYVLIGKVSGQAGVPAYVRNGFNLPSLSLTTGLLLILYVSAPALA